MQEEREVSTNIARDQEVFSHMLVASLAEPLRDIWVSEQKANSVGRSFDRMREHPGVLVDHL